MLITTQSGVVVNSDHLVCIQMQKHILVRRKPDGQCAETASFKVLLSMANGLLLVAARDLSETAARFLRKAIASRWAEGRAEFSVSEALSRQEEGAYYAEDIGPKLVLVEGGE